MSRKLVEVKIYDPLNDGSPKSNGKDAIKQYEQKELVEYFEKGRSLIKEYVANNYEKLSVEEVAQLKALIVAIEKIG